MRSFHTCCASNPPLRCWWPSTLRRIDSNSFTLVTLWRISGPGFDDLVKQLVQSHRQKARSKPRIAFFIPRGMLTGNSLTRLTVESLFLRFRSACLIYALISSSLLPFSNHPRSGLPCTGRSNPSKRLCCHPHSGTHLSHRTCLQCSITTPSTVLDMHPLDLSRNQG